MKPEQQRIAIAEACGWTCADSVKPEDKIYALMCWVAPGDDPWHLQAPPDYPADLNAMHEAEKVLTEEQHCEYALDLYHVVHEHTKRPTNADRYAINSFGVRILIIATATQRAEAFLRTLNLWTES
jgi:hypothetical protein